MSAKQPKCETCGGSGQRPDFNAPTPPGKPFAFKQIPCPDCAEQPKAGEFVKEIRLILELPNTSTSWYALNLSEACDIIDRLEMEARATLGTNVRLKAEYNQLQAQLTAKDAQVQHTIDYCKAHVGTAWMSISKAAAITGLPYTEVRDWPDIDVSDCLTFAEQVAKAQRIVKETKQ